MAKTNFERNRQLNARFGGGAYPAKPATVYVALFTAAPTVAGGGTEVAGGDYARAAVTNDAANFPDAVAGVKSNAAAIVFPAASALWGTAVAAGFFDALSGGNLLDFQLLTTPRTINPGDTFSFSIGQLQFTET
jgi:hypothetical protein